MEPDSSTRKQGHRDSLRCRRPVSSAAGSLEDLGKSEYECAAELKCITGDGHSVALKRGISIDRGVSGERPHPKERRAERGRSCERRRPISPECPHPPSLLFTPTAPSRPTTGSNKGPLPLERGGDTDAPVSSVGPVAPSSSLQPVHSSGQVANVQVSSGLVMSGLTAAQSEEIFLLSREVQTLRRKLALDFIGLSHQEAQFCMGAQATSHEKGMREWPDGSTDKCGEATQRSGEISQSQTNSVLFRHTLEYQNNMIQLITRSQEAIRGLHDCIWDVIHRVMESAGKSAADGLEIALCLVDMLPSIPLHLTFNTAIADLPGFTPEALTYASPPSTHQGAMTAPGKETLASAHGTEDQAMQATWCMMAPDTESAKPTTNRSQGYNDPNIPGTSVSLAAHASTFTCWHPPGYQMPCSPSYSHSRSPSPHHHVRRSIP